MGKFDAKIKKTDNKTIKGFELLFDRINSLIQAEDIFVLNAFYFNLEKYELSYSSYIKVIREINLLLSELIEKEEVFYFEEGKFFSINYEGEITNNKSTKIIKGIRSKGIIAEEENLLIVKQASVKWPEEAVGFNELIKLVENKISIQDISKFPSYPNCIIIHKKDEYLDKVEKRSTQLHLIAKNKNIEVIKQHIVADKTFQIAAGSEGSFEMFYILEGTVSFEDKELNLVAGDSIVVSGGEEERYFETLSDVNLLYISTTPIFASEQKRIQELIELNNQIAEKDNETEEHCNRLQKLSKITADMLGLEEKKIFNLGFASFLHDIGKSKVPTTLLQKPSKLTEEEWEIMKKHTEWGRDIVLENFQSSHFEKIAEIIYQHHERYDGTGYPQGLKGNEILIEAQILTVVDAYDAMVYERPYQRALSREEALAEIKSEKGRQFSPLAVEAFLKAEEKFIR